VASTNDLNPTRRSRENFKGVFLTLRPGVQPYMHVIGANVAPA
jgi:hypothetical protein